MDSTQHLDTRETSDLIASNKVEGTAVYNQQGERLGTIEHFMVDKLSGQVDYAVMTFGGFLGIGTDRYPLPWDALTYSTEHGGYVVDVTKEQLQGAPHYSEQEPSYDDSYGEQVYSYYGFNYR